MGVLYGREMRAALREKTIVLNSLLLPIFLYPLILWAGFSGITFVMGQTEGFICRTVVLGWPEAHPKLRLRLEHDDKLALNEDADAARAKQQIKTGQLDALLEFVPASGVKAALRGQLRGSYHLRQLARTQRGGAQAALGNGGAVPAGVG